MFGRLPSEKECIIYRENSKPVTEKILRLLLRTGAYGFWTFQRLLTAECSPATPRNPARINPEDLKSVFQRCGVLLVPDEHRALVLAFCDSVGFVVLEPFFEAVSPASFLPSADAQAITQLFPIDTVEAAAEHDESAVRTSSIVLPDVTLESVCMLLVHLFAPCGYDPESTVEHSCSEEERRLNEGLQVCYEEGAVCFTEENYPSKRIPVMDVLQFLAAEMLLYRQHFSEIMSIFLSRLSEAPLLERAPDPIKHFKKTKTKKGKTIVNTTGYSMVHVGCQWTRLFERYMDEDRRDEWLRGREEREAGSMYLRHTCGYSGHLPEYKRRFGRTFHVIEESLPILTKPKPVVSDEVALSDQPKRVAPLRPNRNAHHYKLS